MNTNNQVADINDVIPDKKNIPLMTRAAYNLLIAGMFPFRCYEKDIECTASAFIHSFIGTGEDPYKAYSEFCQRIFMTRHFIRNSRYHFKFSILGWLDPDNKHGFAGTARWFANLQDKRTVKPTYLLELKAFPEAMLELFEEPARDNFHYWAKWFIEREAWDQFMMLNMIMAKVMSGNEMRGMVESLNC